MVFLQCDGSIFVFHIHVHVIIPRIYDIIILYIHRYIRTIIWHVCAYTNTYGREQQIYIYIYMHKSIHCITIQYLNIYHIMLYTCVCIIVVVFRFPAPRLISRRCCLPGQDRLDLSHNTMTTWVLYIQTFYFFHSQYLSLSASQSCLLFYFFHRSLSHVRPSNVWTRRMSVRVRVCLLLRTRHTTIRLCKTRNIENKNDLTVPLFFFFLIILMFPS